MAPKIIKISNCAYSYNVILYITTQINKLQSSTSCKVLYYSIYIKFKKQNNTKRSYSKSIERQNKNEPTTGTCYNMDESKMYDE